MRFVASLTFVLLIAAPAQAQLVWFRTPDGPVTHRFVRGRSVDSFPGVHVQLGEETVRVRVGTIQGRAWQCVDGVDGVDGVETSEVLTAQRLLLERSSGTQAVGGVDFGLGLWDGESTFRVLASLGPYLHVAWTNFYTPVCGPHAFGGSGWGWYDLRDGSRIDVPLPPVLQTQVPAAHARMREQLRADVEASGQSWDQIPTGGLDAAYVRPRLRSGRWRAWASLEFWVPYRWGRPSCYGRQVVVRSNRSLGARFEPFERVPAYVRRFLQERPRWMLGGVGLTPREMRRLEVGGGFSPRAGLPGSQSRE